MHYEKENYITARPTAEAWKYHANVQILSEYSSYISGSVLDVGCNHGATTYWLTLNKNVNSIVGVDINQEALDIAYDIFKIATINYKFVALDFTATHLSEHIFDTVVCFHTLDHIYSSDINSFICNIYKNLKFNGYLIISIPYLDAYPDSHHVETYGEKKLIENMEIAGFKPVICYKDDTRESKNLLTGIFQKI